jgi:hypothetical protein
MTDNLHVPAACNENYAMALAVMLASLASNLGESRFAPVHVRYAPTLSFGLRCTDVELRQNGHSNG